MATDASAAVNDYVSSLLARIKELEKELAETRALFETAAAWIVPRS